MSEEYEVYLTQTMSRLVKVQADSIDEALDKAYAEGDFNVNISNNFEQDGEVNALLVSGPDGEVVWNADDEEPEVSS